MHESEVEGKGDKGRYCMWWLDGVKKRRNARSLTLRGAKIEYVHIEAWREFFNATKGFVSV